MNKLRKLLLALFTALCSAMPAFAAEPAAVLRQKLDTLADALAHSPLGQPIVVDSNESGKRVSGDAYALIDQPFATLAQSMKRPSQWCEVMILVINVRHCEADEAGPRGELALNIARKPDQAIEDTQRIVFSHRMEADVPGYVSVAMTADKGPMGTSDYRINLQAIPADAHRSFIHLHYAYADSTMSQMLMQTYLSTVGRDKVGFSVVDRGPNGEPVLVKGVRGAIERTTMRYYLAIAAYLHSLSAPPQLRLERRLRAWFGAAERYPKQLHEMTESEYLTLKRQSVQTAQAGS
ncbi:MAG TPA: hypothetical protein VFP68_18335 [Burkholderiaceae bacterium]|nr:hypothetical protein [Burkholderiaceae bacterium]